MQIHILSCQCSDDSKCNQLLANSVTSSIHEPAPGIYDVTTIVCSHMVSIDTFLSQWRWGQWFKEFVKYTSVPSFSSLIIEKICGAINCLASYVIINWPRAMCMAQIKAFEIQRWGSMRAMCGFSIQLIRKPAISFMQSELCQLICKSW